MKIINRCLIIFILIILLSSSYDLNSISGINNYEKIQESNKRTINININNLDFNFSEIEVISEPIFGQDNIDDSRYPKVATEEDKIYVVWQSDNDTNNAGTDWDIFFRYFDGKNWSEIQIISEPVQGLNINTGGSAYPDITVENGKIYVVWHDRNNTNGAGSSDWDVFYRCNLTGSSWEDTQVISEPIFGNDLNIELSGQAKIAVENNNIYVVWTDTNNTNNVGTDGEIFYRCNLSNSGWEDIQVISEPGLKNNINIEPSGTPDIAVESGKIYVTWVDYNDTDNAGWGQDIFFRCNITGSSWEDTQVISEPIFGKDFNVGESDHVSIAVENNNIYVVWKDGNNTNGAGTDNDIFFRSNLTGLGWNNIQVISEPVPGLDLNDQHSGNPKISIENDDIYVVWRDQNQTNNAGIDNDIFFRCNLTGFSWEPVKVISEPLIGANINTGSSVYPDIEVNSGKSHVVWTDENNTDNAGENDDIFYRSIFLLPVLDFPNVEPIMGNTSTDFNFTITYIHPNNIKPKEITVNISYAEYTMFEIDINDINYIDGKEYFFNITHLHIGKHPIKFYSYFDNYSFYVPLENRLMVDNTLPIITTENNLTAIEDIYYEVIYDYKDIDTTNVGQSIYWNYSSNTSWLAFDNVTARLNGTPANSDVGEYWVNITINDTRDIVISNFTLSVININDAPIIITNNTEIINEDEPYDVAYKAIDIDTLQGNLIWNMNTNASWLEFDQTTAILNGTPANEDVGEYWVNISVDDSEYIDFRNFSIEVLNINDPPIIITKDNTTALEDEFYDVIYHAIDVDNFPNELMWTIATNAEWLTYDDQTVNINGTPTNDDLGEYWINISVSDNEYMDFTNFTLTVLNINDPPIIITENKTNITVGKLYSVNFEAVDIDPPPMALTWFVKSNTSDWLTIDSITGWLNGIPAENDVGSYWVNVSVSDGDDGWDFYNFTLQVFGKTVPKNNPPELSDTSVTPSEGNIDTIFTFTVRYYDVDGDPPISIHVIIDKIAYNMNLKVIENASNGTYEYSTTLSKGTHTYYFMTFDGVDRTNTNNSTTTDIKKIEKGSRDDLSWYWLIWVMIIVMIIISLLVIVIFKKRKATKIPTVRAELLQAPPSHIATIGESPSMQGAKPMLITQPIASEQLPTVETQVQPTVTEKAPTPSLTPSPASTQFQLPQATLTKDQQLNLLKDRFLRGEVTEETYNKLRAEIETHTGKEITQDDSEAPTTISEPQPPEPIQQLDPSQQPETIQPPGPILQPVTTQPPGPTLQPVTTQPPGPTLQPVTTQQTESTQQSLTIVTPEPQPEPQTLQEEPTKTQNQHQKKSL